MHRNSIIIFLFCGLLGVINCQGEEELKALQDRLNLTNVPSIDEAKDVFRKKCVKEKNEAAYENALSGTTRLQNCVQGLVDFETLKNEIEEAKPTGDLDIVFKKYCRKSPILLECVSNFTTDVDPCLNDKERATKKIFLNITESLTNFICYKEGDRIALFIAEGGPECLSDKREAIEVCVNSSMTKYLPKEQISLDSLPNFIIQSEDCDEIDKAQKCIVEELEKCKEPTPANIAESLFKFIKQVTPCGKKGKPRSIAQEAPTDEPVAKSTASILTSSLLLIVASRFM